MLATVGPVVYLAGLFMLLLANSWALAVGDRSWLLAGCNAVHAGVVTVFFFTCFV